MAKWKWTDKLLGKEEAYIDDENGAEYGDEEYTEAPRQAAPAEAPRQTGVISGGSSAALEMKIIKPEKYEESTNIADHLLERRTVVLNLEGISKEETRRILDFLTGTTYAIGGQIKRAANFTYVITPKNVDVSSEVEGAARPQKEFF